MKPFIPLFLFLFAFACTPQGSKTVAITPKQIEAAIANGSFSKAEAMINDYLYLNKASMKDRQKWLFQIEKMNRIRMDFSTSEADVVGYLSNYYDSITPFQLSMWGEGKALEYKIIDGKKFYFNQAARNLFRISAVARKQWEKVHGTRPDSLQRFLIKYLPSVVKDVQTEKCTLVDPINMEVTYTLTVSPNAVPPGELIRAWMPMPRTDIPRQTNVQLISTNQPNYIVSTDHCAHKSIYMEKRARPDEPTVFAYTFSYTAQAEWYNFNIADIKLYDANSHVYQTYTLEQAPHIVFSDQLKAITNDLVGSEQNPYMKVKRIYEWIDKNIPWASAREYSTIDNIPEYVLENKHGDCGQVSLLFITMARYAGIPARWQSGFMMHPGNKDLHDWAEVYYEGIGWVPVDQSFGRVRMSQNPETYWFYTKGIDAFRLTVNNDFGKELFPVKMYPRSETVDFQRGEVEWKGGNLYFNYWTFNMDVKYIEQPVVAKQKPAKGQNYMLPSTDWGSRRADDFRFNSYPYSAGYYPSSFQLYGGENQNDDVIKSNSQRSYLRNNDSYHSSDSYSRYSRSQDNSVSDDYGYQYRYRSPEDVYIPPSERSSEFPGNSYNPTYRRYLREEQNDSRVIYPSLEDIRRIQGTPGPVTPSTDYGYRR